MGRRQDSRNHAAALSVLAALFAATYYIFVLSISPQTLPSAILVYPTLIGGVAFVLWSASAGEARALLAVWRDPFAYLRVAALVSYQLTNLAATYLTGPVDASLLSLVGDVIATPLLGALLLQSSRPQIRSAWFLGGLALSVAGGTLTILGGHSLSAIPLAGWIVVPAIPVSVAAYVILTARANEQAPPSAVVGQSMLGTGLVTLALVPVIPGAFPGLAPPSPEAFAILVAIGLTAFFAVPLLYFASIRLVGPGLPAVLQVAIPVFTLILSWFVLHLPLPLLAVLGIPVAVVGGILTLHQV